MDNYSRSPVSERGRGCAFQACLYVPAGKRERYRGAHSTLDSSRVMLKKSGNLLVVQSRMRGAGMRWAERHVNAILAMHNLACNDHWETGWSAIRHGWQQEIQAKHAHRAVPLSSEVGSLSLTALIQTQPSSHASRYPRPGPVLHLHQTHQAVRNRSVNRCTR